MEAVSKLIQSAESCYRDGVYPCWVARTPRVRVAKRQEVQFLRVGPGAVSRSYLVREGAPPVPSEPGGSGLRATPRSTISTRR